MTVSELESYLQSIVDTLREPLLVLDTDLHVVSANRSFYQTFRVSPDETEGRLVYELGHGQWNIPALRALLEDVLRSGNSFDDFEVEHDFASGGRKVLLLNARKLHRPGNHTEMLLLAIEDVTDRRQAEMEQEEARATLREKDERLRLLVDGARDHALILLDIEGRIVAWQAGAERILGWTEAEALGMDARRFFTPEDREAGVPDREMEAAVRNGRAEDKRWHLKKDGTRFFADGVMTSLRDENGGLRGFAKVLRDATARKRAEDALQARTEELQAAYEHESTISEALQKPLMLEVAEDAFSGLLVATLYEAALDEAQVGGDFFDAFALPRDRVALAIADASGKGLQAAARTMQLKDVLRAFSREYPHAPAAIVSRLNDFVCDTKQYDEYDMEAFSCLSLVILDPSTGEGNVVTAGCEPPLILRANGAAEVVEASGLPLGIERQELYATTTLRLAPGDTLLLVTDGITEARRGNDFLGYEGLIALARQHRAAATLREMGQAILEGAKAFGGTLRDDACLLIARRR